MKNIQIIDGAENCVYDIYAASDEEFSLIFQLGTDIAFIDEVIERVPGNDIETAFREIWKRPVKKSDVVGINGMLFYELEEKKQYYPTRRDEDATNPDGSKLRP